MTSGGRGGGAGGKEPGMTGESVIALSIAANRTSVGLEENSSSAVANYVHTICIIVNTVHYCCC